MLGDVFGLVARLHATVFTDHKMCRVVVSLQIISDGLSEGMVDPSKIAGIPSAFVLAFSC